MPKRYSKSNASIKRLVKAVVNRSQETKHLTTVASSWTDIGGSLGTLTNITAISQGTGDSNRIGNSVRAQKIFVQKLLRVEDNVSTPHATIRVLLVQARGESLSTSDMPGFASPVDLDKMYVLQDRMVNLSSTGVSGAGTYFGSGSYRLKLSLSKGFKRNIHYNDASNIPTQNAIYLYMLADNSYGQQCGFETIYYKDA